MNGPSMWRRAVLHVDMDSFYVSVELLRRPELRGQPVVVGAAGARGVIASASYEARAYGVRSAMPSVQARRLCPHLVFIPGDHARYSEVSAQVMAIFRSTTPLVEPLSLDEAFLDVTGAQRSNAAPEVIGAQIRSRVADEVGLGCSVGLAPNKFLAKLASEAAKPTASPTGPIPGPGVFVVWPGAELAFLHPLPLRALWGVGPTTLKKLQSLGVGSVGELAALPEDAVVRAVGVAAGRHLWALSQGVDDRPVEADRAVKSVSHEETFATDLRDLDAIDRELVRLSDAVAARLREQGLTGRTASLKVRDGEFSTVTRSSTARSGAPFDRASELLAVARRLFAGVGVGRGVRLLGIGVSGLQAANATAAVETDQLSFDFATSSGAGAGAARRAPKSSWRRAEAAVDQIRSRFGSAAIGPAVLAGRNGLAIKRRGEQQWGPQDLPDSAQQAPRDPPSVGRQGPRTG